MTAKRPRGHPLWRFDRKRLRGNSAIIGVDEAGRGALAGPVVAAAVRLDNAFYLHPQCRRSSRNMSDSKLMSAAARETAYQQIELWSDSGLLKFSWAEAKVREIDHYNILGATRIAMERALRKLGESLPVPGEDVPVLGMRQCDAPRPYLMIDGPPMRPFPFCHEGIPGGDGQSLAIAMASIIAKVMRDGILTALHQDWPDYGFARHKGYGTAVHRSALLQHGPCAEHRPLFVKGLFDQTGPTVSQSTLPLGFESEIPSQ